METYKDWKVHTEELIHLLVQQQVPKEVNEQLERYIEAAKNEVSLTLAKAIMQIILPKSLSNEK